MEEQHQRELASINALHSEKLKRLKMQARAIHEHDIAGSLQRSKEMNTAYETDFQQELLKVIAAVAASWCALE